MDEFDYLACEEYLLETQNTHKLVQNLRRNSSIEELSGYVNHLVFLLVYRMNAGVVPTKEYIVNMPELGKILRWHGFFIKKLQAEKRSFYFIHRSDGNSFFGDNIYGGTQDLVDFYYSRVDALLKASQASINVSEILIKTLKELPVEMQEN